MDTKVKYPRTFHLPSSPGHTSDDKVLKSLNHFNGKEIVITEKMDGENTTLYSDYTHARSLDSVNHWSRNWLKNFHASIGYKIPNGVRICGENLQATHSIFYNDLESYFLAFSVWDGPQCLSWDDTIYTLSELGIHHVPVIYRGMFSETVIEELIKRIDTEKQEGFVIRLSSEFEYDDFGKSVAKWVRPSHVQSAVHWTRSSFKENLLRRK
jgi:hypothetical protein